MRPDRNELFEILKENEESEKRICKVITKKVKKVLRILEEFEYLESCYREEVKDLDLFLILKNK